MAHSMRLCTLNVLMHYYRKFKDLKTERMELSVSFNTSPSQGRYISADFISLVLKEKMGEPQLDTINWHTD